METGKRGRGREGEGGGGEREREEEQAHAGVWLQFSRLVLKSRTVITPV